MYNCQKCNKSWTTESPEKRLYCPFCGFYNSFNSKDIIDKNLQAKELLQEFVDKQGHESCWYYPDIFNKLCDLFDIKKKAPTILPPRKEFECGCKRYQNLQYGEKESWLTKLRRRIKL